LCFTTDWGVTGYCPFDLIHAGGDNSTVFKDARVVRR
jgi:hypothetical protein